MVVTDKPEPPLLLRRRRLTAEEAARLQAIGRLYRFGVPDLD